jgi:hypothetical protein
VQGQVQDLAMARKQQTEMVQGSHDPHHRPAHEPVWAEKQAPSLCLRPHRYEPHGRPEQQDPVPHDRRQEGHARHEMKSRRERLHLIQQY